MALGPVARKWLVAIVAAIIVVLLAVWLYTAYAANEVEPEVGDDPVALSATAPPAPPLPRPTPPPGR